MAYPSSSKGRSSQEKIPLKSSQGRKRVRAETTDIRPQDLFREPPDPRSHDTPDASPGDVGASFSPRSVPKSFVKFIVGLFLLPLAWILTKTFFQAFTSSIKHGLLANQSFGCFAAGMVLFGILYLLIPQKALMIPYVLGHEVTHALWVKLFGGKVADHFHVSQEGGHVLTDRVNTWIILAPYFFPIYSLLVVTLYGAASLAADISAYRWILFLLLGLTLAFHLVFTCLLIVKGQPDLHYGGTFFSLMVIYLINLLVIIGLLLMTARQVRLETFARLLIANTIDFVEVCHVLAAWVLDWIGELSAGLGKQ